MKMVYNVKDKPKAGHLIIFAFQQLLAIMAATIAVPFMVSNNINQNFGMDPGMDVSAALFGAGVGTLIYVLLTKGKSPVFLGSSFAFIEPMCAAFAGALTAEYSFSLGLGFLGMIIGAILAGLVYVAIALIVKFAGVKWIAKLMPAVVIGPIVAIIGLSLAGSAVTNLTTVDYKQSIDPASISIAEIDTTIDGEASGEPTYAAYTLDAEGKKVIDDSIAVSKDKDTGELSASTTPGSSYVAIICGLVTLAVVMLCSVYGKKMSKLIPFIIGILAGYACATIFYLIGLWTGNSALMIIDYSALVNNFSTVSFSSFLKIPNFSFLNISDGFKLFDIPYFLTLVVAYVPVAFVVFAEHIADHKNLSSIIEQDLLEDPGLSRTLLGDGLGSMAGAFFGGCPNTTYGESIGCVAITKNASTATIICTGIEAILIAFIAPFVAFLSTIPSCVMGGVCIALYGFIAVSGLKMLQKVDLDEHRNLFTASVILITGVGGFMLTFGKIKITTIACALILGILTNWMLSSKKKANKDAE